MSTINNGTDPTPTSPSDPATSSIIDSETQTQPPSPTTPTPTPEPPTTTSVLLPPETTSTPPIPTTESSIAIPTTSSEDPPPLPVTTSTSTAPPPSPTVITSIQVITKSATAPGESPTQITVIITTTAPIESTPQDNVPTSTSGTAPTSSSGAALQPDNGSSSSGGGLSDGGKTAIAVVIPVVAVAVLVLAGLWFWRRRKQKKSADEARRKEVEEYGFNPNNDPTLPVVAGSGMMEDSSGYRGWGNTTNPSNRKTSTTISGGFAAVSDSGSNPGGYQNPGSPQGTHSDSHSSDPLVNGRRETMDSDGIDALGSAPAAGSNSRSGVQRGPSNASSSYSVANHSDHSSGDIPMPNHNPQDYYSDNTYYQGNPYSDPAYGQQPVIKDVSARRNTRIENPTVFPQPGNSGIAQNF